MCRGRRRKHVHEDRPRHPRRDPASLPLVLFVLGAPPTPSGALYTLAPVVLASALIVPARWSKRVALVAAAMVVLPMLVRLVHTKPGGDVRAIDRIIDERDVAVNASRGILAYTHFMADP